MNEMYWNLKKTVDEYIAGDVTSTELKHESVLLGIYQQRNDLFMMRIRLTGGEISIEKLNAVADMMAKCDVGYSHITSRQDLQLQDVQAKAIYPILEILTRNDMPFKGGGGNTYRNILVSSDSGISPYDAFDVLPHANALNQFLFGYEKAVKLPRKLKIGFSSGAKDSIKAPLQDVGFIAKMRDGQRGFEVYGGGGMGKESMIGVKLFDFLPEKQFAKCAKAITDLFHDHGDRTNRDKARLRFVLQRLGEEKFIELFQKYFSETELELEIPEESIYETVIDDLTEFEVTPNDERRYAEWLKYAVSSTKFGADIVSLRLFVPCGNLKLDHIRKIANLAKKINLPFIRLTQSQDLILPLTHASALPVIFNEIENDFPELDLLLKSFKGHLTACVGAEVCKIGIANSTVLSDRISRHLDEYFIENPAKRSKMAIAILEELKISGCHNACSGHVASKIGLRGMKKKIDGLLTEGAFIHRGGHVSGDDAKLATSKNEFLPVDQIAKPVMAEIQEWEQH